MIVVTNPPDSVLVKVWVVLNVEVMTEGRDGFVFVLVEVEVVEVLDSTGRVLAEVEGVVVGWSVEVEVG